MKQRVMNDTGCDFLDKYGVASGNRLITFEGETIPEGDLCTEHCPYEECVLVVKDRKKSGAKVY